MTANDIDVLKEQCRSGDPRLQSQAILGLLEAQAKDASMLIAGLLTSHDPNVRGNAAYALGFLGTDISNEIGPLLMALLDDPDGLVRSEVAEALGRIRYRAASNRLQKTLQMDGSPLVRASIAETLGELADQEALDVLEHSLYDPDESVRAYSLLSIGLLNGIASLPKLMEFVNSEQVPRVRAECWGTIYRLGEREGLSELLELIQVADEDLMISLLNIIEDLTERKYPPTIANDTAEIQRGICSLQENALYRAQVIRITENLANLWS